MVFENLATWEVVIIFVLFVLFMMAGAVVIAVILFRQRWKFKVIILEDVTGKGSYQPTMRDRARLISFGDGGEEIFYLRKQKKYRVAYGKRVGKNYVAWAIGSDGYWYNIVFGNVDKKLMELGVNPVDRDMRFSMASLRKGIENRYNEKTFFEKWGVPITIGILIFGIVIQGGVMWFLFDKMQQTATASNLGVETARAVMEIAERVLARVDNINTVGGSGIVPA